MFTEEFFEIANNHFNDALPFVLYRKPNRNVVRGLFQNDATVYTSENLTESGFIFAPFNDDERTVLIPTQESYVLESKIDSDKKEPVHLERNRKVDSLNNDVKFFHIKLVSKAIEAIGNNEFEKVVLSRRETISLSEENPIVLFQRLLQNYPTAFNYCWYHPKIGLWLGATPETLLGVTANRFTTMALAGTQAYTGEEAVTWQAKEREEQQLVTDFIVSSLDSSVSSLETSEVETIRAGSLLHLRTKISGVLNSSLKEIVKALHPTPAVCGLPKTSTKQFILENENYNREFYTGFLGELNIKEKTTRNSNRRNVENNAYASVKTVSNLFVNLRCMQLTDTTASIYSGGGITKDSIPENEWEETVNKTQTMKKVLF